MLMYVYEAISTILVETRVEGKCLTDTGPGYSLTTYCHRIDQ